MGTQYAEINQTIKISSNIFSFIDIEELMSVMVMLGNPRTEDEVSISQSQAIIEVTWSESCLLITGQWQVRIMIQEEDKNGDGLIDREEFFSMLQKNKELEEDV